MSARMLALVLAVLLAMAPGAAHAGGAIGALGEAQASFNAGDYYKAAELVAPLLDEESISRADRATALRLYGLALYFLGKRDDADAALLEYLKLEPEAHLDPALVPPDGIAFFEDVRSRHAVELRRYKPRPRWRDSAVVSVIPLFGQLQNGDKAKGWALIATEGILAVTTVTTYVMFRRLCDNGLGGTCSDEGTAKAARTVNLVSGGLLLGVVVYGVIDGAYGYGRRKQAFEAANFGLGVGEGSVALTWSGTF